MGMHCRTANLWNCQLGYCAFLGPQDPEALASVCQFTQLGCSAVLRIISVFEQAVVDFQHLVH
jgi:hypothetical protein